MPHYHIYGLKRGLLLSRNLSLESDYLYRKPIHLNTHFPQLLLLQSTARLQKNISHISNTAPILLTWFLEGTFLDPPRDSRRSVDLLK